MMNRNLNLKKTQSGVVLIVSLISLVILLLASVALIRSTDTNLLIAGHLSFKRDVLNQAERAIPRIRTAFETGALSTILSRESDLVSSANYYATIQPSNSVGIPTVLLNTANFDAALPNNNIVDTGAKVVIRYVIDRMSLAPGPCTPSICTLSLSSTNPGGDAANIIGSAGGGSGGGNRASGSDVPVYRISIRAIGPRNVETFMQYTFSI